MVHPKLGSDWTVNLLAIKNKAKFELAWCGLAKFRVGLLYFLPEKKLDQILG